MKVYKTRSGLYKHKKTCQLAPHQDSITDGGSGPIYCQETACSYSTKRLYLLRKHLQISHNVKIEQEVHTFANDGGTCKICGNL